MKNATEQYHKLLETILKDGKKKSDRTGTGTISIPDYHFKADMSEGFPLITTKRLHTKSIVHELLWFLKGDTNTKYLNENGVTIWDEWADENGDLGPVYGKQWVDWEYIPKLPDHKDERRKAKGFGGERLYSVRPINQIQNALDKLRNNPTDRGNIVSAWNVGELDKMALRPCHWAFQLITEELTYDEKCDWLITNKDYDSLIKGNRHHDHVNELVNTEAPKYRLHLKWHQRSVDTFLGLPFNIASYALLLHMFSQQANMVPGTLIGDLSEVHIYDNHIDYVKEQLERDTNKYPAPTLTLTKPEYNGMFMGDEPTTMFDYKYENFEVVDYEYYPNWKNVPIAV
jgi:thymidylate synthase